MMRILTVLLLSFIAASCNRICPPTYPEELIPSTEELIPCTEEPIPYTYEGIPKPSVALISVIDSSDYYVPWHLDQELSDTLRYQLMYNGNVFLQPEGEVSNIAQNIRSSDYFSTDLEFTRQFQQVNYLVALELIEHALVPFEREKVSACFPAQSARCSSMLQMKMRLRVIALRSDCPRVILQEIFTSNSMIPADAERLDYERLRWGTPGFQSTPMAQAHKRLVRDLACRIETVIEGLN